MGGTVKAVGYLTELRAEYEARAHTPSDIVEHLPKLHAAVERYTRPRVLELGVRSGNSTSAFLAAAGLVHGHVWSVDVTEPAVPEWWRDTGRWTLTVGNDLDPQVLAAQPGAVDVLFIDTSHTYEDTMAELAAYVPRVRPGGTVLCHDTELERPEQAPADGPPFPVARALDAYCEQVGLTWVNRTGCYGLGVIDVP